MENTALQLGHVPPQPTECEAQLLPPAAPLASAAFSIRPPAVPDAVRRVTASIEFMQLNLEHPLSIAQLCRMTRLSPSHYSALFKRQTGHSPLDYFLQLRMQSAARLLETTHQNVKQIAARLGYRDALYFTRVFTGVHGVSPTEYRRRRQPIESCIAAARSG